MRSPAEVTSTICRSPYDRNAEQEEMLGLDLIGNRKFEPATLHGLRHFRFGEIEQSGRNRQRFVLLKHRPRAQRILDQSEIGKIGDRPIAWPELHGVHLPSAFSGSCLPLRPARSFSFSTCLASDSRVMRAISPRKVPRPGSLSASLAVESSSLSSLSGSMPIWVMRMVRRGLVLSLSCFSCTCIRTAA